MICHYKFNIANITLCEPNEIHKRVQFLLVLYTVFVYT